MIPGLLIAAPKSGSGKTTVTLGLLRALVRRGVRVSAAKNGPDYIDPAFHAAATGRPSFNLDTFAMPAELLNALGARAGDGVDLVIAEGSMGLFDGIAGAQGETGASADLAARFGWPVVLVLDVSGHAQSAGATALGAALFDPRIEVAGVILNRVVSARHERLVRDGVERTGIPVLGAIPRNDAIVLPERHLGLVQASETSDLTARLDALADLVERTCDVVAIAALAGEHRGVEGEGRAPFAEMPSGDEGDTFPSPLWGGVRGVGGRHLRSDDRPAVAALARLRRIAKPMRQKPTAAERRLWWLLRANVSGTAHFRRQVPIDRYIADFADLSARLIVEVDGPSHFDDAGEKRDQTRDAALMRAGYRVIHVTNTEVMEEPEAVLELVLSALAVFRLPPLTPPPPAPPREGEGRAPFATSPLGDEGDTFPSPLRGGVRGGGESSGTAPSASYSSTERIEATKNSSRPSHSFLTSLPPPPGRRVALARDAAFTFIYPHILAAWREAGVETVTFSPLADEAVPEGCDALWLPGGYPELHAPCLAAAERFRGSVRAFAATRPVHGECGGYMVLGETLISSDGITHAMLGLLPVVTSFAKRKMTLGYRHVRTLAASALGPAGSRLTGHEFHYATIVSLSDEGHVASAMDGEGRELGAVGHVRGHVSGSFFHVIARSL